jgi:hypothetical protein
VWAVDGAPPLDSTGGDVDGRDVVWASSQTAGSAPEGAALEPGDASASRAGPTGACRTDGGEGDTGASGLAHRVFADPVVEVFPHPRLASVQCPRPSPGRGGALGPRAFASPVPTVAESTGVTVVLDRAREDLGGRDLAVGGDRPPDVGPEKGDGDPEEPEARLPDVGPEKGDGDPEEPEAVAFGRGAFPGRRPSDGPRGLDPSGAGHADPAAGWPRDDDASPGRGRQDGLFRRGRPNRLSGRGRQTHLFGRGRRDHLFGRGRQAYLNRRGALGLLDRRLPRCHPPSSLRAIPFRRRGGEITECHRQFAVPSAVLRSTCEEEACPPRPWHRGLRAGRR